METRLLRATYGGWKSITQLNADKRKDITQALAELLVIIYPPSPYCFSHIL